MPTRTRIAAGRLGLVAVLMVLGMTGAGCSDPSRASGGGAVLRIGLLAPLSGPYKAIGDDMIRGWNLYLDTHGGKLGGRTVEVVTADEGDGGVAVRAAVDRFLKQEYVSVIVGTATAPAVTTVAGPASEAGIPFIGTGGRPSTLDDIGYVWHTSFMSTDYGQAVAAEVRAVVDGPVYVIGPDYQGGKDQIGGFVSAFEASGGRLANPGGQPAYTPWPATENFAPWLAKVRDSGAKAVYAFYAGAPAVAFVKQFAQFVPDGIPLYGPGFLTEGAALTAEGDAAEGIYTVMNYAPGLTHAANTSFRTALSSKYQAMPNLYHVTSYDAAAVLDLAIAAAGADPTPEAINTAISKLGSIDSPRGTWNFSPATHTPVQQWYLRQVRAVDGKRDNVVVKELGSIG